MKYSNAQCYDDISYLAEIWCPSLVSPVITATGKYTIKAHKDCIFIEQIWRAMSFLGRYIMAYRMAAGRGGS